MKSLPEPSLAAARLKLPACTLRVGGLAGWKTIYYSGRYRGRGNVTAHGKYRGKGSLGTPASIVNSRGGGSGGVDS